MVLYLILYSPVICVTSYTLSLDNLSSPSTDISFIVATKYVILDNLPQITKIVSFPATTGNFVIKSTVRYVHGFSYISLNFNFPTNALFNSLFSNTCCIFPHIFLYTIIEVQIVFKMLLMLVTGQLAVAG